MRNVSIISATYAAKIQVFVSTEETRYYLNGFLLEPHAVQGAYIVATDGHRLGIFHDAGATVAQKDIVRLSKDALKACKAKHRLPLSVYVDHDAKMAYVAPCLAEGETLPENLTALPGLLAVSPACIIDGSFPDWTRVCPPAPTDDATRVTSFNSRYLGAFAAVSDSRSAGVTVYAKDPTSPAWVFVNGQPEFVGVLMPLRGAEASLPSWLFQKPAAQQAAE